METFLLLLYISGAARSQVKAAKRQHRPCTGTALIAVVLLAVFTQSSHSAPTSRTQHHHSNPCGAYNRHDMTALDRANTLLEQVRHVINTLADVRKLYVSTRYVIVAAKNRARGECSLFHYMVIGLSPSIPTLRPWKCLELQREIVGGWSSRLTL